jgi:hypothetical protein
MSIWPASGSASKGVLIAESIGQCGKCHRIIEKGTEFRWRGSSPAVPVHVTCPPDEEPSGSKRRTK